MKKADLWMACVDKALQEFGIHNKNRYISVKVIRKVTDRAKEIMQAKVKKDETS